MLSCQKDLFSLPRGVHYLNCAYMAPLSTKVVEAGIAGVRRKADPSGIGPDDFFGDSDRVRRMFAGLVHVADPAHVAIVPAVSYGVATAARNTRFSAGANIVLVEEQFPSHVLIWRRISAEQKVELRTVAAPGAADGRGRVWNQRILEAIDRRTAAVALPHVHWADGTRFDLEEIGRRARDVDAALIIDGTQSVGALPFDVAAIRPDALICAGYKWLLGPFSIGLAYYGPRYHDGAPLEETWLAREHSENFRELVHYRDAYQPGAIRFDVGERCNFILLPMLIAALEHLLEWGVEQVQAYCRALTAPLCEAAATSGFRIEHESWRAAHLFGLRTPAGLDLSALDEALRERRVIASLRGSALRVSPHVYNDATDVDALIETLRAAT